MAEKRYPEGRLDVASAWKSPQEIVDTDKLSLDEKIELLEMWQLDAERLADSEAEGMGGGEPPRLREVTQALDELRKRQS
jgi:hypothetical protein